MTRVAAPDPIRPRAVLFACGLNAVRSPMAAALARQMLARAAGGLGRRAQGRARSVRGRRDGGDRHRHCRTPADDVRGAGGLGRSRFRSDRHARAGGASQGDRAHAHGSPPKSNIGRRPTPPLSKATASSASTPIAPYATSSWSTCAPASPAEQAATNERCSRAQRRHYSDMQL